MTIYKSQALQERSPIHSHGLGGLLYCDRFVVDVPALAAGDILQFGYVPKYARVISAVLKASDLDTGAALTINVGDSGNASRLLSASNVGQAGGAQWTAAGYRYGEETLITGTVASGPVSGIAGTIELLVSFRVEDPGMYDFESLIEDFLIGENGEPLNGLDGPQLVGALG